MTDAAVGDGAALKSGRLQVGDVDLEIHRGGAGKPLVFLHGAGGFNPSAPFAKMLARQFDVIAPIHPGFGTSSLPFWMDCVDDFVHAQLDVLDKLDLRDVTLVGASLGGWVAADLATKNTSRISRIVLVSPVGIKVGPRDKLDIPDIFATSAADLQKLTYADPEKFRFDPSKMSDEALRVIARNRETMALVAWEPYMHNPKLKHRLHRIDRPTLILRGAQDGLVSQDYVEAYAKLIPGARCELIANAGHSPQNEQPEAFVERVQRFAKG
jgi:pimeloyl-ACP methyl ester carboxylesterase